MLCKIVLGGTLLLFVTRATFDATSYQAAVGAFRFPGLVALIHSILLLRFIDDFLFAINCSLSKQEIYCLCFVLPSNVSQDCFEGCFLALLNRGNLWILFVAVKRTDSK